MCMKDGHEVEKFRKVSHALSTSSGCLLLGTRVVIPEELRLQVLELIHLGHFGMENMKQLVYWPGIDDAIEAASRNCQSWAEHQNRPPKPAIHPWMLPEKPWSRIHIDHAINFMGSNWLVVVCTVIQDHLPPAPASCHSSPPAQLSSCHSSPPDTARFLLPNLLLRLTDDWQYSPVDMNKVTRSISQYSWTYRSIGGFTSVWWAMIEAGGEVWFTFSSSCRGMEWYPVLMVRKLYFTRILVV